MRTVLFVIVAAFLAGCATAPATNMTKVHDQKYNTTRYVTKQADSEFVGTSASTAAKVEPSWYKFGHP
jgi:type IV pilus biogenesis protein CpaD/CtpE